MYPSFDYYSLVENIYRQNSYLKDMAKMSQSFLNNSGLNDNIYVNYLNSSLDLYYLLSEQYEKPSWGINKVKSSNGDIDIKHEIVKNGDFADLVLFKRFKNGKHLESKEKILLIAPMSGHFATLLRDMVNKFLHDFDVYITDWHDAKQVPKSKGKFCLENYIDYVVDFINFIGKDVNAIAVCQPGPALLCATSYLAMQKSENTPKSMILMGSPIDARKSPTSPNILAENYSIDWFKENMIFTVPAKYKGAGRRVYPGFVQLYSFLNMNPANHILSQYDYLSYKIAKKEEDAKKHKEFYQEYLSVSDLHEDFYLQTLDAVFKKFKIAKNNFLYHDTKLDFNAIEDTRLLTIEGENDDISGIGQTQAAHDICKNIKKRHDYIQKNVGHYGVFNGSKFRSQIYPVIKKFIQE